MASKIFKGFTNKLLNGLINLTTDTLKISLHTNTFSPNVSTMQLYSDLTNELVGTGYTAGGKTLGASATADDATNSQTDVQTADVTWSAATFTNVRYAVIRDSTVSETLICAIDFGSNQSCAGQDFIVAFNLTNWLLANYN